MIYIAKNKLYIYIYANNIFILFIFIVQLSQASCPTYWPKGQTLYKQNIKYIFSHFLFLIVSVSLFLTHKCTDNHKQQWQNLMQGFDRQKANGLVILSVCLKWAGHVTTDYAQCIVWEKKKKIWTVYIHIYAVLMQNMPI